MTEELFTIQEAADFFGVSTRTLRRWEEKGFLVAQRTFGNQRRYSKKQLESLIKSPAAIQQTEEQVKTTSAHSNPIAVPFSADAFSANLTAHTVPKVAAPVLPKVAPQHMQPIPVPPQKPKRNIMPVLTAVFVMLLMVEGVLLAAGFAPGFIAALQKKTSQTDGLSGNEQVLAAEDRKRSYVLKIDVPAVFNHKVNFLDAVEIEKGLQVGGQANLFGGVNTNNANIDAGTGQLTASNIIYSLLAGSNITITGDPQNPTISAEGDITTIQGLSGALTLTSGSGIGISGLNISNTGVLSFGGQTGDVSLGAGSGISVSGTTITNSDPGSAQNIFKEVIIGGSSIFAGSNDDSLTFTAGSGITLTPDATNKTITITSNASGTLSGLTPNGILYATSSTDATSLAPGTSGYILQSTGSGTPPEWVAPGTLLGSVSFDAIASGTNTTAAMVVGSGASLGYTGTGTINASSLLGSTWATPGAIGSTTPNTGAFTTLTANTLNGLAVTNTGSNTLTIANGKTVTVNNSLTLAGTDSTTFTFPSLSGTVVTTDATQTLTNKTITAGSNTITGLTNANLSGTAGITNANLANSSLTVTAGTGLSGGGAVSLGGSVSLSNAGVTQATGGTGITIDQATGDITITNSGVTSLAGTANQVSVSGATGAVTLSLPQDIHAAAAPTFAGLTLSGLTTNGGILYTNGSGTVAQTSAGNSGQCLTSAGGGSLTWATCAASNYWELANGALSPINSTLDLLIGGTATTSAKFAFMNVSGSGTPTASISGSVAGNAISLTGDGVLATTLNRSLVLNPNGGNVGIGTSNPTSKLSVFGNIQAFNTGGDPLDSLGLGHDGSHGFLQTYTGNLLFNIAGNRLDLANDPDSLYLNLGDTDTLSWNYEDTQTNLFRGALGTLQTDSTLNIFGGDHSGGKAALIVDQVGANTNDIFTASASGTTRFVIGNNGNVQINTLTNCDSIDTDANGVLTCGTDGGTTYTAGNDLDLAGNAFSLETTLDFVETINLANTGTLNGLDAIDATTETTIENAIDALANLTTLTLSGDTITDFTGTGLQMSGNTLTTTLGNSIANSELDNDTIDFDKVADNLTLDATTSIAVADFNLVLGTNSGNGTVVVQPNAGGQAALIVNKQGENDIFTASASGVTKFTIRNNGDLDLANYNNCGMLTTTGTVLTCSAAPVAATNYWQMNDGAVSPFSNTLDLLVGGTGTSSAKFAVLNVNNGTPTASVSAGTNGAAYLTAAGTLQTTANQSLSLGGDTTGNILLNSDGNGQVGIGTSNPTATLDVNGNLALTGTARRILADFSDATITNRTIFQSSVTNGITSLGAMPNGTNSDARWSLYNSSDPVNAAYVTMRVNTTRAILTSGSNGSASNLPLAFEMGFDNEIARFDTNGRFGINTTAANLAATLDVRGNSGTLPIASFSGQTSHAGLIVDNRGVGDLFTASSSGLNRFVIKQDGNVGIGTTLPNAKLDVRDATSSTYVATFTQLSNTGKGPYIFLGHQNSSLDALHIQSWNGASANEIFNIKANGSIGVNTYSPNATLDLRVNSVNGGTIPVASISGATAKASLIVDNSGLGDLFTASKSGATKFTLLNNGNVRMANYNTAGGIFYGQADGTLALSAAGTSGQCLKSNGSGAPTWDDCGGAGGDSHWAITNGLLHNGNLTTDFAIGGTSSTSAKFKVSPSGTSPTASVAGQTSSAALLVDQAGNGDIFTASRSGATKFTIRNSGVVVIGDATNGITFDPLNGGPSYAGNARPTKTISLQPEYPGAVLTAFYGAGTDTNITGFMTSDAETTGTNNLRSYYEWERTADATQHFYTVAVRVRLPKDFSAWATSNAIQVDYKTESATNTVSDLDVRVYLESDSTLASTDAESLNNASTSWTTISIDDSSLNEVDAADETAVIYLRMGSASSNHVRVGEIRLNYLSSF